MANISLIHTSHKIHCTCNTYFSNFRVRNINVTNILGIGPPMLPDEQASECSAPGRITNITDTAVAAWLTGRSTKSRLGVRRYKHWSRCVRSSSLVHISAATPCILIRRSVTECQQGELGENGWKLGDMADVSSMKLSQTQLEFKHMWLAIIHKKDLHCW